MKILSGKKEYFFEFLDNLKKGDRIAILSHNDLDGIASAVIISEILKKKNLKTKEIHFLTYDYNMFKRLIPRLKKKKINKIFISDIANESDQEGYLELKEKFKIFVVDHHVFTKEYPKEMIKTSSEDCATFCLFELAKEYLGDSFNSQALIELVCATMIAEFSYSSPENLKYIQKFYPEVNSTNAYDNSKIGDICKQFSSTLIYFTGNEKKVFKLILKSKLKKMNKYVAIIEKEIEKELKRFKEKEEYFKDKKIHFYYNTPKFKISSVIGTKLSLQNQKETFILAYNIDKKTIGVSARNQEGIEDMNLLMKKGINGLEHSNGGGHVKASGAKILKKDLNKFKENLLS